MIKNELTKIMGGYRYPQGSESRVYALSEEMTKPFGEPCVIKIYTKHAIPKKKEPVPLEKLAQHELMVGRDLQNHGLNVPTMHEAVLFDSPPEWHTHYIQGRQVPGLVMGRLDETREFEDLAKHERQEALGNFVDGIITAMRNGYHPFFDTCHNRNVTYDSVGNAIFYDFSQWENVGPIDISEVDEFFKEKKVLPEGVWLSEGYLESII